MNTPPNQQQTPADKEIQKPTLLQVFGSVLSAIFGVQKGVNRERDFSKGDPKQFLAVYITIVISIVIGMVFFVRLVISVATAGS